MPIKVNETALSKYSDKAFLRECASRLDDKLYSVICNEEGDYLYCSANIGKFTDRRTNLRLCSIVDKSEAGELERVFEQRSNACLRLDFRKTAFALVEYLGRELFSIYLFIPSQKTPGEMFSVIRSLTFSIEYAKRLELSYGEQNRAELLELLDRRLLCAMEYDRLITDAKESPEVYDADLGAFFEVFCDYVNKSRNSAEKQCRLTIGKALTSRINPPIFLKFVSAITGFLFENSEGELCKIKIGELKDGCVDIVFSTHNVAEICNDTRRTFLVEIAQYFGWNVEIDHNFETKDFCIVLTIPAEPSHEEVMLRSGGKYRFLSEISGINESAICSARILLHKSAAF